MALRGVWSGEGEGLGSRVCARCETYMVLSSSRIWLGTCGQRWVPVAGKGWGWGWGIGGQRGSRAESQEGRGAGRQGSSWVRQAGGAW